MESSLTRVRLLSLFLQHEKSKYSNFIRLDYLLHSHSWKGASSLTQVLVHTLFS